MKRITLLLTVLLCFPTILNATEMRTWTGSNGKRLEAQFISYDDQVEIVKIRLKDGKEQNVKISLFSKEDQEFVKNGAKEKETDNPFDGDNASSPKILCLQLNIDEYGDGTIQFENSDQTAKDDFKGAPFKLLALSKSSILKGKDGLVKIIHDFADPDPIEAWTRIPPHQQNTGQILFDATQKTMQMCPKLTSNQKNNFLHSGFDYKGSFRLPLSIVLHIRDCDPSTIRLMLTKTPANKEEKFETMFFTANIQMEGNKNSANLKILWQNGPENSENLLNKNEVSIADSWKESFRLPFPNIRINNRFDIALSYGLDTDTNKKIRPLILSKIEITGQLIPKIGAVFGEKDSLVFVRSAEPNRPASKAGIQNGDLIVSINGKMPKSSVEAVNIIGSLSFTDKIMVKIKRKNKEMTIPVEPDM